MTQKEHGTGLGLRTLSGRCGRDHGCWYGAIEFTSDALPMPAQACGMMKEAQHVQRHAAFSRVRKALRETVVADMADLAS